VEEEPGGGLRGQVRGEVMKYFIYKTTNIINGKFYWGVHYTCSAKNYFGSGKVLKQAIKKHGKENFKTEIKFLYETAKEAYEDESFIVTQDLIDNLMCYNIALGGLGGVGFLLKSEETRLKMRKPKSKEHVKRISDSKKGIKRPEHSKKMKGENHPFYGKIHSKETRQKMKESHIGKKHSDETIRKIAEANKRRKL
jgi:group I intron endonuclease